MAVVVETTLGDFTVDLYVKERPQTCRNFLKLCKIKYYNWSLFFTVQSNFIAQTGDPTATGKGGESVYGIILGEKAKYYEAEQIPKIKHEKPGLLSMVNCGNNMLGSQFFVTLASDLQSLDGEHCIFGEITEGLEIILKFNEAICDTDNRPYQDIRITHTVVLDDPYDDPKGLQIPDKSPSPTQEVLQSDRIGADEVIDDTAGMTAEEIAEMQKEKEAKARATILEIVGDIPDADMAPPENVLFVCKLNPVTNDDDLEIIFSRFGKIVGCEVIRDKQTGDSLQYAFIEFAERKSCEEAYFKMDNVLIDDRRIHVDFSQSVAKMRWRGKGKGIKYFNENDKEEKKEKALRIDKKNKNERRESRSESPRRDRSKYEDKEKTNIRRDTRQKKEKNDDARKRTDNWDKKPSHKKQDRSRSRSNEKSRDRRNKSRSRSNEKSRGRRNKSRSRSNEKNRDRRNKSRSKSRSNERKKGCRDRSRSIEISKDRREDSRSKLRDKEKTERSRDKKDRSRDRSKDRRARSTERSKDRRDRSRERSKDRKDRDDQYESKSRESIDKRRKKHKYKLEERSDKHAKKRQKDKHKSR